MSDGNPHRAAYLEAARVLEAEGQRALARELKAAAATNGAPVVVGDPEVARLNAAVATAIQDRDFLRLNASREELMAYVARKTSGR